jgi:uncharacterized protein
MTTSLSPIKTARSRRVSDLIIGGVSVLPGEWRDVRLKISETYTGDDMNIPLKVVRAKLPGPRVFVTAAIHGDEINGTGIIHDFLFGEPFELERGTLILVPVVNVFGFETHERYLPDRRDLNRSFPGSPDGSLAARMAHSLMTEIVSKCDYGIDLHSAAFQRTNFPNVRADWSLPEARRLARAFGCSLILEGKGPEGSFRREACKAGVPTVILEAGEPWKMEPTVLKVGVRGVKSVLRMLQMIPGEPYHPAFQTRIRRTVWQRAEVGGILKFHVSPGEFVDLGQPLASNYSILGNQQNSLLSPVDGIVLSVATLPAVKPGEPVCHIAVPERKLSILRKEHARSCDQLDSQIARDLRTNITVIDP